MSLALQREGAGRFGDKGTPKGTSGSSFSPDPRRGGTGPAGRWRQSPGTRLALPVPCCPRLSLQVPTLPRRSLPGCARLHLSLQVPTCPRQSLLVPTWLCQSPPVPAAPCNPHLSASVPSWLYQSLFWSSQSLSVPVGPCLLLCASAASCEVSPCPFLLHPHVPSGLFVLCPIPTALVPCSASLCLPPSLQG